MPQKSTNQILYVPKITRNNSVLLNTTWYPTCRPIIHYRKQGATSIVPDCCLKVTKRIGDPLKMLGKTDEGLLKICDETGPVGSKFGNVIGFSGNATLRSSVQPNLSYLGNNTQSSSYTPYYTDYSMYLRGRGNTYDAKNTIRKIPGRNYVTESEYYETTEGLSCKPNISTTYKPNNKQFAVQGAVTSESRLLRLKYNTITKNNASFSKPFKTHLQYQDNPLFFEKNKTSSCPQKFCLRSY
jgi:hypothetical protein